MDTTSDAIELQFLFKRAFIVMNWRIKIPWKQLVQIEIFRYKLDSPDQSIAGTQMLALFSSKSITWKKRWIEFNQL